jgi:hypothetical protein
MSIYENITREEYNAIEGINASLLKGYYPSTEDGKHGESLPRNETSAMAFGTSAHSLILEPHLFFEIYTKMPNEPTKEDGSAINKNTKIYKEWKASLPVDTKYISNDEWDLLYKIDENIHNHKLASELLNECPKRESCVTWEVNGVKFKALIDMLGDKIVADLKTCREIPIRIDSDGNIDIERTAQAMRWKLLIDTCNVLQAYHYFEGCKKNGLDVDQFKFLLVENNKACKVAVINVTPDTMLLGKAMRNRALENYLNKSKETITFNEEIEV